LPDRASLRLENDLSSGCPPENAVPQPEDEINASVRKDPMPLLWVACDGPFKQPRALHVFLEARDRSAFTIFHDFS
jgi:hypothetical protein